MPELLHKLNLSIVITAFQADKVIFVSPKSPEELVQLPRTFQRPMGLAIDGDKMAIATQFDVTVLKNSISLAQSYPNNPDTYDAFFAPRASYYTGGVDIHDLHWGEDGLYAVNTSFSCICKIDEAYSFTPIWKPHFISSLENNDRCHLNGLAMSNGKPKFVTSLGTGDHSQSWRENIMTGGVVIDVDSNEIVCDGLCMPHSPNIYNGELFVLLSGKSMLGKVDVRSGKFEDIMHIPGFVRGMTRHEDFLFVATSRLRKNSSTFRHLNFDDSVDIASVLMIHLPTTTVMAKMTYNSSVDEIYDIQVLHGATRPNIINTDKAIHQRAIHIPDRSYWDEEIGSGVQ